MAGKRVKKETGKRSTFGFSLFIVAIVAVVAGYFLGNYYIKMASSSQSGAKEQTQVFVAPSEETPLPEPVADEPLPVVAPEPPQAETGDLLTSLEDDRYNTADSQPQPTVVTSSDGLVRVQVGAFNTRPEAMEMSKKLQADGYPTYITSEKPFRIQVGAFKDQNSAKGLVDQLLADGYDQVVLR